MKDTKEKILETAFVLMIRRGMSAVSTGDITKAIGVARSLPYRYFPTKRDLVYETFKFYFCDRFFDPALFDENTSLKKCIDITTKNLSDLITNLGKDLGASIDVFDYNTLYLEALKREPRFKRYAVRQTGLLWDIAKRAIKNGEIKPFPVDFIGRVFLDICGRGSDITSKDASPSRNLEDILSDMKTFYRLIKK